MKSNGIEWLGVPISVEEVVADPLHPSSGHYRTVFEWVPASLFKSQSRDLLDDLRSSRRAVKLGTELTSGGASIDRGDHRGKTRPASAGISRSMRNLNMFDSYEKNHIIGSRMADISLKGKPAGTHSDSRIIENQEYSRAR